MEAITFGDDLPGFAIGNPTHPGVLLIQEWWGVTDIVKAQAVLLAERGFRVLVPDLYKGTIGVDQEEASHLLTTLDYRRAVAEIGEAARHLLACGSPRVGILGGCMGGALAFAAAQHCTELSCAVPFYGTPAREMPWIDVTQIKIPVQYHTGMLDRITGFSDPASGTALLQRMAAAGCVSEMHLYENTPHSFLNALVEGGVTFLEKWGYGVPPREQVQLAFDRAVDFLLTHLQPSAGVEM